MTPLFMRFFGVPDTNGRLCATETINLKDQPSEFGYMITSTQGQTPTSLTCFDYQD